MAGLTKKEIHIPLSDSDMLDITFFTEKGKTVKFSINYRARIKGEWREVYRVDTAHGYLHEQKYWLTQEPIKLSRYEPIDALFSHYLNEIRESYTKYRNYYAQRKR